MRSLLAACSLLFATQAWGSIDPNCTDVPQPADYDEQTQGDFLANYFALSTTYSPIHAPIPHAHGHGALGIDFLVLPPLSCSKRYVLNWTKTEETNKAPVVPRLHASIAFPGPKNVVPYASVAYLPPIPLLGTRNVILSAELGIGGLIHERFEVGGRFHATMHKSIADVATAFNESDPVVNDLFLSSTFGLDASFGVRAGPVTPYLAAGFTDASTFFFVGDDNYVANNLHPYFGPTFSLGVDALLIKHLRLGGEFYAAPGGYSVPDKEVEHIKPFTRYGHLYTARFRIAYEL